MYAWPNGKVYDGDFKNGKFHGNAKITTTKGLGITCVYDDG